MIPLILLTQSNQVTSKGKHTMEKQVTKDASGSDTESEKEAEPWRCEENRARYERNKRELILTEAEQEEMGSDMEEFLWTYDDDKPYEEYQAEAQQALEDLLSYIREKHKRLDAEAAKANSRSK
ncbi:hypothetical protein QL285_026081 [Trifolium repens]|nr:hypothetical protein QL285_026081 [Trifolium repens]